MVLRIVFPPEANRAHIDLVSGRQLVGSDPDSAIHLLHPTVSRRHAELTLSEKGAFLEDSGSRNGTFVDGRRIRKREPLTAGCLLRFGSFEARLVQVPQGDVEPAFLMPRTPPGENPEPPAATAHTTQGSGVLEKLVREALPRLLEQLQSRSAAFDMAQSVGVALFEHLPCTELEIVTSAPEPAVWFRAELDADGPSEGAWVRATGAVVEVRAKLFPVSVAGYFAPAVDIAHSLVALARPRVEDPRAVPEHRVQGDPPPLPTPETVEPRMRQIYRQAATIAKGDIGVLIRGESGTGKEVLARYIHAASGGKAGDFWALNCAALPRDLLELELFGIEAGVATGVDARPGKFELADSGTLLLDEIGDMAPETQARILRVLQEKTVYRLGGKSPRPARARVLAATHRDLDAMLQSGAFRADLYHRVAGWVVELPPLRHRRRDIPNLAAHFLMAEARRRAAPPAGISRSAMDALAAFHWPGNVRELETEIARASLFLGPTELLESRHLRPELTSGPNRSEETLKETLEKAERQRIELELERFGGKVSEAARSLGLDRSTLYRRMKALDIQSLS